ncbi:hypothetical protein D9611_000193 [Ephemerocybe angulata]|uniref:RecQ mediated genome instability protein 1 OB-fold domain-containing protein n=1 Tax=Ephemerocybe angulata TaxID=980116 RepID=A0A8H5F7D8_9AGAR|nr:hypothetical protein D9611_000193 [Tulosesus angulatus]
MSVPAAVEDWVAAILPSPKVNQTWLLHACYEIDRDWPVDNPGDHLSEEVYLDVLERKMLHTSLSEVTTRGSGLPPGIALPTMYTTLKGPIVLEIVHMTDVGVSAFVLEQVHLNRERAAYRRLCAEDDSLSGLTLGEKGHSDSVATPAYPRHCLRLTLSDGNSEIEALELIGKPFSFVLGETPIDVPIVGGIAFLDPDDIEILGGSLEEEDTWHYSRFREELTSRMKEELVLAKKHGTPCKHLFATE